MIWKVIDDSTENAHRKSQYTYAKKFILIQDLLIVLHSIATFNAKYVAARCHTGPIKIPIVLSAHWHPITFFKIADQHRFVHVGAETDANPLILTRRYHPWHIHINKEKLWSLLF